MQETAKPGEAEVLDKVVLLIVTLQSRAAVEAAARDRLGLDPQEAADLITEAFGKILAAALVNKQAEAGAAIIRLRDLYERALRVQDVKTALAAQKETHRLLDLYNYRHPAAHNPDLVAPPETPGADPPGPLHALKIISNAG